MTPRHFRVLSLICVALSLAAAAILGSLSRRDAFLARGIPAALPEPITHGGARPGVNVYLERLGEGELRSTLEEIRSSDLEYVKQSFYFREAFDWESADRIVEAIAEEGLTLVPLLDGNPDEQFAPPRNTGAYAAWAGEFARRYADRITYYMIWDEPNLASHWGGMPANAGDYAALLSAAASAIRQNDPDAVIVTAPLAPTVETGPENFSEPIFLRRLYQAGAAPAFDVVASKPYGFDKGPDDRRVAAEVLNFSRVILLHEEMVANGDADTALWAGSWGWNSLPADWSGRPSIWGQTDEEQRAAWTEAALDRATREWPWMGVMFLENWKPASPPDDPRWGFSIAGRPTAGVLSAFMRNRPPDVAMPGFHLADPGDPAQTFEGSWEFSPEFGADIGQTGDVVRFSFWGTDVGLRVRRADFRARLYATVDGEPANALPEDENGAALVLTAADPDEDDISTETIATGLSPGPHVLEVTASRGWDQWALNGFSAGYRPASLSSSRLKGLLAASTLVLLGLAVFFGARAEWGQIASGVAARLHQLSDRAQLALTALAAAVVGLTGWLTWGQDALGAYRRLGDAGQLAATATAAVVFYVTPSFVIFLLALLILFVLIVLRPSWGIALIVLTMPFYVAPLPKLILGYRFSPVEVFTLVTTAAWLVRVFLDSDRRAQEGQASRERFNRVRADWAVVAFVLVATASIFFAERVDVATTEWRVVIIEPALLYLLLRVHRLRDGELWVIIDAFLLSGLIIALVGLVQYVTGIGLIAAEGGLFRLRAFYGSPNNVALYLGRLLPLLVAMLLLGTGELHGRRRLVYSVAILPIGLTLLLTFSKGALFLGIPASLLFVFWIWQRRSRRKTWPWVTAVLLCGLAGLLAVARVPAFAARLNIFGETGFFRISLWRSAFNMFLDHPVWGVGLDNFLYAYRGRYILDAAWQEPNLNHPHNIVLDLATRLGLLGLLAGGWMFWEAGSALARAIRLSDHMWLPVAAGMMGSLIAIITHGLVDHSLFLVDLAFTFFLLLGVGVILGARPADEVRFEADESE